MSLELLRPQWLLLLPVLLLLIYKKRDHGQSAWNKLLSPLMAQHLVTGSVTKPSSPWPLALLSVLLCAALVNSQSLPMVCPWTYFFPFG